MNMLTCSDIIPQFQQLFSLSGIYSQNLFRTKFLPRYYIPITGNRDLAYFAIKPAGREPATGKL